MTHSPFQHRRSAPDTADLIRLRTLAPVIVSTAVPRADHSILVVDDNPATRYAVSRTLRSKGYKTVESSTGAEALELSEFVSAIVLDVHLPDLNGFEVCRILRRRQSTAMLPIVHMSSIHLQLDGVQIAQVSGSDSFFSAPVDPESLTQTLDRLITKRLRLHTQSEPPTAGARSGSGSQAVLDQMTRAENSHRA